MNAIMENRAILLTPPGVGAIAVVRLRGEAVVALLSRHFSRPAVAGKCVHGDLTADGMVLDDAVVMLGEDGSFADVNVHGGAWVVQSVLDLAGRCGFRVEAAASAALLAEGAVDGRDILEREMLAHLPLAQTEQAIRILLAQRENWRAFIASAPRRDAIQAVLEQRGLYWLLHMPRVAIVGPANAGKSTLANQLFAQDRSITADLPGTTRDWVGEMANIDGLAVMLVDTPGWRRPGDAIERTAIERSAEQIGRADLIILVLDAARPLEPEQAALLAQFPKALRVINKSDCAIRWDIDAAGGLRIVATTGIGVDGLRLGIRQHFGVDALDSKRPAWWTARQREIIAHAMDDPAALAEILRIG